MILIGLQLIHKIPYLGIRLISNIYPCNTNEILIYDYIIIPPQKKERK